MSPAKTAAFKVDEGAAADVRQLIIESAVRLIDKYGYSNIKISDITNNVGLTTGAFYYYFQGKEDMLEIVSNFYISIAAEKAKDIFETEGLSAREKLSLLLKEHCRGIANYHSHVSVFYREHRNLSPDGLVNAIEKNRQFLSHTTELVKQGVKEGSFRADLDPKVVALAMIGMCNWLYQWFSSTGKYSIDEIADMFVSLTMGGLLSSPAGANWSIQKRSLESRRTRGSAAKQRGK